MARTTINAKQKDKKGFTTTTVNLNEIKVQESVQRQTQTVVNVLHQQDKES